jgi:hypothetical protein
VAAWRAASVAKSAANDSSKIANEQTNALMAAAKANALASRINFYEQQLAPLRNKIQDSKVLGEIVVRLQDQAKELEMQQKHLVYWLDRQTEVLKVGLRFECPGSPHNSEVTRWGGQDNGEGIDN